jgi:hypothetical protein
MVQVVGRVPFHHRTPTGVSATTTARGRRGRALDSVQPRRAMVTSSRRDTSSVGDTDDGRRDGPRWPSASDDDDESDATTSMDVGVKTTTARWTASSRDERR